MNGTNITCCIRQTARMMVGMVFAVVLPSSVAGGDNHLL